MARYGIDIPGATLGTVAVGAIGSTTSGAGSVIKLYEFMFGGEQGASATNRMGINRVSVVGTITVGTTAQRLNNASVAAAGTYSGITGAGNAFSAGPTFATDDIMTFAFNGFGGVFRWVAPPDSEVVVQAVSSLTTQLAIRAESPSSGNASGYFLVEEL
jgi:hypothetical protein